MTISVLIVDDEPLAREGVALHLENEKDFSVIAMCANGRDAINVIHQHKPDLAFLDVSMPGLSGFDVIDAVGIDRMPAVIFLTAHENFAVRAFDVCALDYLLKPIDVERLSIALEKTRDYLRKKGLLENASQLQALLNGRVSLPAMEERIVVKSHGHMHFIPLDDILWVEANGDYVDVHTSTKTHLVRDTMHNMEQQLRLHGFQRVHRSSIVKITLITELVTTPAGDYYVILQTGDKLKLSRNYRELLLQKLDAH